MEKDKPFVDLIYSFAEMPQKFLKKNITQSVLNNKKLFFMWVTAHLKKVEKQNLCKISCCIYWAEKIDVESVKWYNKANGKFWDNEIPKLINELYGIECTYEPINK